MTSTPASSGLRKNRLTRSKKSRKSASSNPFCSDSIGSEWVTLANPAAGAAPTRRDGLSARIS
jgi:hypothetical protein